MHDLLNVRILRLALVRAGIYVALMIGALSTGFFWTWITPAQASVSLDERVSVSYSRVRFNRRTRTFDRVATVTNKSEAPIYAPLSLVIRNIDPATINLENAAGITADGASFVEMPLEQGELLPNKKVSTVLRFKNSTNTRVRKRFDFEEDVLGTQVTLSAPGSLPFALSIDSQTNVRFMVRLFSTEQEIPSAVILRRLDVAETFILNDAGEDGDDSAKDSVFSANIRIDTADKLEQECLSFQAEVEVKKAKALVTSPVYNLCVTGFPTAASPSNLALSNQINFAEMGEPAPAVANEVIVEFNDNTTEERITEIVAEMNGTIVGTVMPAGIYQVLLDAPLSAQEMLDECIAMRDFPEIKSAYPNLIAFAAADPNDSLFKGSGTTRGQDGLKKINASAAWDFVAEPNDLIAVLDTGVDVNHEDLAFKNTVKSDDHGHGTNVVGIIGALTNNEIGIAGAMGGNEKVTARNIKVIEALTKQNEVTISTIAGSIETAQMAKPKIMNLSFGCNWSVDTIFNGTSPNDHINLICSQINKATKDGILVVAAAGNFTGKICGNNPRVYPAACNVDVVVVSSIDKIAKVTKVENKKRLIVVANSKNDDKLNENSFFGDWVDVVAPGTEILTTKKGGGYERVTGTSFSAAFVTAAAAVLLSRYPEKLDKIEAALQNSSQTTVTAKATGIIRVGNEAIPKANGGGVSKKRIDVFAALKFLNDTPTINNQTFSVVDSAENESLVGKVMASDPEEDDLFFSIIEGNREDTFIINNLTGEINVNNNTILGSDSDLFTLTVQVEDGRRLNESTEDFIFLDETKSESAKITINVIRKIERNITHLVGDKDNFQPGDPEDVSSQSPRVQEILAQIGADPGQGSGADLDEDGSDRPVGITHFFELPEEAEITSATITLRIRGNNSLVHNDFIIYDESVREDVSVGFLPLITLRDLNEGEPESGEILELVIDLANVPVRTVDTVGRPGGRWSQVPEEFRDLLPQLEDGQFDMIFSDDVTVDFSELDITFVTP